MIRRITGLLVFSFLVFTSGMTQGIGWEKYYGLQNRGETIEFVKTSYDNGILINLCIWNLQEFEYGVLIKCDINGIVLWSKTFFDSSYKFFPYSVDEDNNGNIIIVGETKQFDAQGDPFIMKLNSCGQKIWCKVLNYPRMNYSRMVIVKNDNYLVLTNYASNDFHEGNQIRKFDTAGNQLSVVQLVPGYGDSDLTNAGLGDFMLTSDNGMFFTGYCYYRMPPPNQNIALLQHLFVKTDSLGNEQWHRPSDTANNHVGSIISSTEQSGSFYSVGYNYSGYPNYAPYFCKSSQTGQLAHEETLHPDTLVDWLSGIKSCGPDNLIIVGRVAPNYSVLPKIGLFKTDTAGIILKFIRNDHGAPYPKCIAAAFDNKYLISGYAPYDYDSISHTDGYLIKVNQDLDYDSIYTYPFIYNSLCPVPIPTDTISCNCDLITGIGEAMGKNKASELKIFPNPACDALRIIVSGDTEKDKLADLAVYDLFGKKLMSTSFRQEVRTDVSFLTAGVYIVTAERGAAPLARGKLVVVK
jgi:hypothetical protein